MAAVGHFEGPRKHPFYFGEDFRGHLILDLGEGSWPFLQKRAWNGVRNVNAIAKDTFSRRKKKLG